MYRRTAILAYAVPASLWLFGSLHLAMASSALVALGPRANTLYISQPATRSLVLARRDGAIIATRRFDSPLSALALDAQRGILYVAQQSDSHILILAAASLRLQQTISAVAAASDLAPVAGQNALYLFDPKAERALYLTYSRRGATHLATVYSGMHAPAKPGLRVSIEGATARSAERSAFWANGFRPGEQVALSWGASSRGVLRADRLGIVTGSLPMPTGAAPAQHIVGLYGLSSHLALSAIVDTRPRRHAARRRAAARPPLYLGMLPGPIATAPRLPGLAPFRVPYSAGAAGLVPLALAILLVLRARRKKRQRLQQAARRPTRRPAARR